MTFGIAVATPDYACVVTDRRSTDGLRPDDEYEKSGYVEFSDGRFAYTMSGLAGYKSFNTAEWLAEEIAACGRGGAGVQTVLARVAKSFAVKLQKIRPLPDWPRTARTSVLFAGFEANTDRWLVPRIFMLSNYQWLIGMNTAGYDTAQQVFNVSAAAFGPRQAAIVSTGSGSDLFSASAMSNELIKDLAKMSSNASIPPQETIRAAVKVVRSRADAYISENCTSILIPGDWHKSPVSEYHSHVPRGNLRFPTFVQASYGPLGAWVARNVLTSFEGDPNEPPMIAGPPPSWKRKACWCGSGKRYDQCHRNSDGARQREEVPAGTTGISHEFDILPVAPAEDGFFPPLPNFLLREGTGIDQYKVTNMRTSEVLQDPPRKGGRFRNAGSPR